MKIGKMGWAWNAEDLKRLCCVWVWLWIYKKVEAFHSYPFKKSRCAE